MDSTFNKEKLTRALLVILIILPVGFIGLLSVNASTTTDYGAESDEAYTTPEGRESIPDDDELSLPAYTEGQDPGATAHEM